MNYAHSIRHPLVFLMGLREATGDFGMTYDDDPESPRSVAYDMGRNLGEWLNDRRETVALALS